MKFLKKYILFPKRFGIFPYIWMIWIIYPITDLWPFNRVDTIIPTILLICFLWFYRNGYSVSKVLPIWIYGQYGIIFVLTITNEWIYLLLFSAWEISSLTVSKRTFHQFLAGYYMTLVVCMGLLMALDKMTPWSFTNQMSIVMVLFLILSPLGGKSVANSYRRSQQLRQQNSRYANLIKRGERERIARDLHDTLGQSFSMITIKSELAAKLLDKHPDQVKNELKEISEASRQNLQLVRNIVTGLRQTSIAEIMIELADELKLQQISLMTDGEGQTNKWPHDIQNILADILREAITNVMRYSRADQVEVHFTQTKAAYHLMVADNGKGYKAVRKDAHGIKGMAERAKIVGGKFGIQTSRSGTVINVQLPKEG